MSMDTANTKVMWAWQQCGKDKYELFELIFRDGFELTLFPSGDRRIYPAKVIERTTKGEIKEDAHIFDTKEAAKKDLLERLLDAQESVRIRLKNAYSNLDQLRASEETIAKSLRSLEDD